MKNKYQVTVTWLVGRTLTVEADSETEAHEAAHSWNASFTEQPPGGVYIESSFEVDDIQKAEE